MRILEWTTNVASALLASMEDIYVSPQVLREPQKTCIWVLSRCRNFGHANFYV